MDTERVALRPAQEGDIWLAFGIKKAALGKYIAETYGWDEDEQRRLHQQRFSSASIRIITAEGHDVGLISTSETADCLRLLQLFLLPDAQGKGIGSYVLAELLREADRLHRPVAIRVLKSNPRAKAFFQRHGFTLVGETDTHYTMERSGSTSS